TLFPYTTLFRSQDTIEAPEFVNYLKANFPNNLSTKLLTSFPATNHGFLSGTVITVQDLAPNCATTPPLPGIAQLGAKSCTVMTDLAPNCATTPPLPGIAQLG